MGGDAALEPRIVIAGTGRAGTTLLVQILTDLGLPTGFKPDSRINETARAGLERSLDGVAPPRIVKDPGLSKHLGRMLDEGKVAVEHVIVPMRDLDVAAASRVRATKYGTEPSARGGLFGTRSATKQKEGLALVFYELFDTITRYDLPHTLLLFPRLATDWEYTYEKLRWLDPEIGPDRWKAAIEGRADPSLIHQQPLSPAERSLAAAGTVYTNGIKKVAGRARRTARALWTRTGKS